MAPMPTVPHVHFKAYKPFGMLSQFHSNDAREQRKKRFLGELHTFPDGVMSIGRLDEKSEGLLLLSTDGGLSDAVNRSGVEKEYCAQLDGTITDQAIALLQKGVVIGLDGKKYRTRPCMAKRLVPPPDLPEPDKSIRLGRHRPTSWIGITLTEGKFRQVRKMTAAVGFPTLRLVRIRIGGIYLNKLRPGTVQAIEKLLL